MSGRIQSTKSVALLIFVMIYYLPGAIGQKTEKSRFFTKAFMKAYSGFGFFTPGAHTVSSSTLVYSNVYLRGDSATFVKEAKHGIGYGARFGMGIEAWKNDNISVGLNAEFQFPARIKESLNSAYPGSQNHHGDNNQLDYAIASLIPYVNFMALSKPKFYIYTRIGALIIFPFDLKTSGSAESSNTSVDHPGIDYVNNEGPFTNATVSRLHEFESRYEKHEKITLSIGLNVAFGINFRINDRLRCFAEIFGNYSALAPTNSRLNEYLKEYNSIIVDTVNFHNVIVESKKVLIHNNTTEYKEVGTSQFITNVSHDLGPDSDGYAQTELVTTNRSTRYSLNLSALGINIGIVYKFH